MTVTSCQQKKTEKSPEVIDTIPVMVMQVQKCSRLYTAEAHVHKIITHDDQLNLQGSLFKKTFSIHVPGSNRKIAIPMDATIKAYIDFKDFSSKNVKRQGEKIEIVLPDPQMTLTSSKIDHKAIKQYVSFSRSNFSDAELAKLEQQEHQEHHQGHSATRPHRTSSTQCCQYPHPDAQGHGIPGGKYQDKLPQEVYPGRHPAALRWL